MNNSSGFSFDTDNFLRVDGIPLVDFIDKFVSNDEEDQIFTKSQDSIELVPEKTKLSTPIFLYSKKKLIQNLTDYKESFQREISDLYGLETHISYSLKANFNPSILRIFHSNGSWCSLVNKNELKLALKVGFKGENLIFNGNGKTLHEIELAAVNNCNLNIDSYFNLLHTIKVAKKLKNKGNESIFPLKLIVRLNQEINAQVHQYLGTSVSSCKFGVYETELEKIFKTINENRDLVKLIGFHAHLGSTIKKLDVYQKSVENIVSVVNMARNVYKIETIDLINFGGGLGIDYEKHFNRTTDSPKEIAEMPSPSDLAKVIGEFIKSLEGVRVVVEPGRSLVGNSGILLTNLIGIKQNDHSNFLVIDASMCECIRPCLYSAYHHIDYVRPVNGEKKAKFDIVGPVCESGDFLGKNRYLAVPNQEDLVYLAIMDIGAYCGAMASNYNLHSRPTEIIVDSVDDGNIKYLLTRKSETFEEILSGFTEF